MRGKWRNDIDQEIKLIPIDENILEIEPVYCDHFGCGKRLTLQETLCGNRCTGHMEKKEFMFCGNY